MGGTWSIVPTMAAAASRTSPSVTAVMSQVPVTSPDSSNVLVAWPSTTSAS